MRKKSNPSTALETALRQTVPPLRAADPARVLSACARVTAAPPVPPLLLPQTFIKPLLRVAACCALLFGIAVLLRPRTPAATVPNLPPVTFNGLTALRHAQALDNSLASEAATLASDLADLTAVLNERSLAILF